MKKFVKYFITIFIICLFILVASWLYEYSFRGQPVQSASNGNVSGWAWSENIGWISFNGSNYGVNIDSGNGKLSGHAWSENIGWISFNESDTGAPPFDDPCADATCIAKAIAPGQLGKSDVDIHGWARVLAYGDGWDGWIRFDHGRTNEVYIDINKGLHGWAWGSDVVGWIDFSEVIVDINATPTVSCDRAEFIYCVDSRHPILYWNYSDPESDPQEAYQVQADNDSNFSSPEDNTGWHNSSSTAYTTSAIFSWNTTYYWRVQVRDSQGRESAWSDVCSFITPLHAYPEPDFSWLPEPPVPEEEVQFTDDTTYYNSIGAAWSWAFQDANPSTSTGENPKTTFQNMGSKQVDLTATDSDGYSCSVSKAVRISLPLPEWKEIIPW